MRYATISGGGGENSRHVQGDFRRKGPEINSKSECAGKTEAQPIRSVKERCFVENGRQGCARETRIAALWRVVLTVAAFHPVRSWSRQPIDTGSSRFVCYLCKELW